LRRQQKRAGQCDHGGEGDKTPHAPNPQISTQRLNSTRPTDAGATAPLTRCEDKPVMVNEA